MVNKIDRLKAQLLTSGLHIKDQVLFQIINQLIDAVSGTIASGGSGSSSSGGGGSASASASFATIEDEQAILGNSRQIYPGAGIQFNNQGQKLIISGAYPLPDYERYDPEVSIPLPGIQGPQGIPGPSGAGGSAGLTIPLPYEYDLSEIEIPLIGELSFGQYDQWISPAFDPTKFTASGTMTWTVAAGDVVAYAFAIIGRDKKTMALSIYITTTTVVAPLSSELRVAIPGGYIIDKSFVAPGLAIADAPTSGVHQLVLFLGAAGATYVSIYRLGAINWLASTNNCSVYGNLVMSVK